MDGPTDFGPEARSAAWPDHPFIFILITHLVFTNQPLMRSSGSLRAYSKPLNYINFDSKSNEFNKNIVQLRTTPGARLAFIPGVVLLQV